MSESDFKAVQTAPRRAFLSACGALAAAVAAHGAARAATPVSAAPGLIPSSAAAATTCYPAATVPT